jgi:uroporphyrinogen decarboxylase
MSSFTSARLPAEHPLLAHATGDSRLVRALRGDRPAVTPVWFMRQAGRSLPEYRAIRATGAMLDACLDPAIASEITMQPVRRHGVDAAIFFSDIVVPLRLAGVDVDIVAGRGPVFGRPVDTGAAVAELTRIDPEVVRERAEPVAEAVRMTTEMLAEESERRGEPLPLIGFAGAPFTLAAYLVEGGPSKDQLSARRLLHTDPSAWSALLHWLSRVTGAFLALQIEAGASAGQLFDSWAGGLAPEDYRAHVLPYSRAALEPARALRTADGTGVPLVHFGVGTGEILRDMADAEVDAVGVDYRVSLRDAAARIDRDVTLQGNLDPALLSAPDAVRRAAVARILADGTAARAHVFNLGHGVPAETDPDVLGDIVRQVHEWRP